MNGAKIIGIGSYVPEQIITNHDLAKIMDTNDEWIQTRTGIKQRRISKEEDTSILAIKASQKALENSGITGEDIDLIIVATMTPDSFMPSTACLVQVGIGAKKATCFDISAACSGFVYAINTATQFIRTGVAKNALVIGAETVSKIIDWNDRRTAVLFGDGAGAVVLTQDNEEHIISTYTGSNGSKADALRCTAMPLNNPYVIDKKETKVFISMDGGEVFKFASNILIETIKKLIENSNYNLEDIKYIVPHQANYRIIEYVATKLNIDINKFYLNLENYGNTSSASIPIALDEMKSKELLHKGEIILLIGFGGGLTWGGVMAKL